VVQKFPLTENTTIGLPLNLPDLGSMRLEGTQAAGTYTVGFNASYKFMGGKLASDIATLADGDPFWVVITRNGSEYRYSINLDG
jgi:hypothetical protein